MIGAPCSAVRIADWRARIYGFGMRRLITTALMALLVASGCGGSDTVTTTGVPATTTAPSTTTTVTTPTTTSLPSTTTTTAAPTTTSQQIDVYFEGGQVVGPERFDVAIGEEVSVWVLTDVDEEVHVHGYDLFFAAKTGIPLEITFVADAPGIFEVEVESTHTLLFELEVTP